MIGRESVPGRVGPEIRLLLDCSRTRVPTAVADRIRRMPRTPINWDRLTAVASFHGVLPLLCYNLNRLCAETVPATVLRNLQASFRANSARNLSLAAELLKVLQFLKEKGVEAIPFKGPTLAASAYGNLGLRQFCDLDVLVQEKDFHRAKDLFLDQGYQPWKILTPHEEAIYFRVNHAYTLVRPQDGMRVDLHWRITQERYAFALDVEGLWKRRVRVPFCGREILSLAGEDLFVVLCLHSSKHHWERLAWICDVAEVVRANPGLRWDHIMSRSDALHCSRAVLVGLILAKDLLDISLPEGISPVVKSHHSVPWVSRLIQQRLFRRTQTIGPIERGVLFFVTRERLQDKFPYLAYTFHRALIPNEQDKTLVTLPRFLSALYYPLRLMRLTTSRTHNLLSRLLGREN